MRSWLCILVIVSIVFVAPALCPAQTIDTFWLEGYLAHSASELAIGPEGDIWFSLGSPARLMRISNDAIECVYNSGIMDTGPYQITITPDGTIWLEGFQYMYSPDSGLSESGIQLPEETYWFSLSGQGIADADCRMFVTGIGRSSVDPGGQSCSIYEVGPGIWPQMRYCYYYLDWIFIVSARECWALRSWHGQGAGLCRIDLETGAVEDHRDADAAYAKDGQGLLWVTKGPSIGTLDGESFSVFAEGDLNKLWYHEPVLAADGAVWSVESDDNSPYATKFLGISRFMDGEKRTFTTDDGLLTNGSLDPPVIDYDGNVWLVSFSLGLGDLGLSRITDGGWPPMRLMLNRVETPESILVEAQVINNGPVVGVDVYLALQANGQLLFWPNWQPLPSPVQVNLRPGHNQTATIISAPRSSIPPGTYTFWGCMTGRNTQKLIGPLDRKFESLTIEID